MSIQPSCTETNQRHGDRCIAPASILICTLAGPESGQHRHQAASATSRKPVFRIITPFSLIHALLYYFLFYL